MRSRAGGPAPADAYDKAYMGTDAFFPFRDGVDVGIREGVSTEVQPGGSNNDYHQAI